jgi:hypothetical protein
MVCHWLEQCHGIGGIQAVVAEVKHLVCHPIEASDSIVQGEKHPWLVREGECPSAIDGNTLLLSTVAMAGPVRAVAVPLEALRVMPGVGECLRPDWRLLSATPQRLKWALAS